MKPNNNSNYPSITALRMALLLVAPQIATVRMKVQVSVNGAVVQTLDMAHPNLLPPSDYSDFMGRPDVAFSLTSWSIELEWKYVVPGLSLSFADDHGRTGALPSQNIDIVPPAEVVIHSTRIGMLTDPPITSDHYMYEQPELAGADYFNMIPGLSKLTLCKADAIRLSAVILADGVIYNNTASADNGTVYNGDLWQDVAFCQFHTGLRNANLGLPSTSMCSNPNVYNFRVILHSVGNYSNGIVAHGLLGGAGMASLLASYGNEASHELGHSWGLGHYPGANFTPPITNDKVRNAVHHADSGWGYIPYRRRFLANLDWKTAFNNGTVMVNSAPFTEPYLGYYTHGLDSQSGGYPLGDYGRYTLHTGYSGSTIQSMLTNYGSVRTTQGKQGQAAWIQVSRPIPDTNFASGYKTFYNGTYVDTRSLDMSFSYPIPTKTGVSIFTILGGYNPTNASQNLLYPPLRSNYGLVFRLPSPNMSDTATFQCWLNVSFADGSAMYTLLDSSSGMKQIQYNIEEATAPQAASLGCGWGALNVTILARTVFPQSLPPMPPPAVFGQDAGFAALRQAEIAKLDSALGTLTYPPIVTDLSLVEALKSWRANLTGLSASSRLMASVVLGYLDASAAISYALATTPGASTNPSIVKSQVLQALSKANLTDPGGGLSPVAGPIVVRSLCADYNDTTQGININPCNGSRSQQWFMDLQGRVHSLARADRCVAANAWAPMVMATCSASDNTQGWRQTNTSHIIRISDTRYNWDYYVSAGVLGSYSATTGTNQIWSNLSVWASPIFGILIPASVRAVVDIVAASSPNGP
ncbi:peptidase M66-domain-containing protein [Polychytrium aggregatum]|uniref:peptidase M66-domain-containing protein n=1 Tax=Polychytrium aggregatum TaxID=110093 RepID=UPI0022FED375|nr:peptidase M66-domain-containing protein [Polychytrium aggregatum]KAI9209702.1 peptidase M66-domain-containing protein [Polychytrium aggregatum]